MTGLRLSVIVVSRHRPEALVLCLTSLSQQDFARIEVIVVADPAGVGAARKTGLSIKTVEFDEPNISRARNIGLDWAAGDIVAFIDDDAVAEPTWAGRLIAPFDAPDVIAATGFVRGRNGISYQWKAFETDAVGRDFPLDVSEEGPTFPKTRPGRAIKTVGTNCAFRLSVLREIGGFDEAFHFFLDETDVNRRLIGMGRTAVVPMAQVAHGFLPSRQRRIDRVPLTLFDIGASTAAFALRHAPNELEAIWLALQQEQRGRLIAMMLRARLSPFRAWALLGSLRQGWQEGLTRAPDSHRKRSMHPDAVFLPLQSLGPASGYFLSGWRTDLSKLHEMAAEAVGNGQIVTVLCLSKGFRRHKQLYDKTGYWVQMGGIWGKSDRTAPLPFGSSFGERESLIREWCSKRRDCRMASIIGKL